MSSPGSFRLDAALARVVDDFRVWSAGWGPVAGHPSSAVDEAAANAALAELLERLHGNYPFFHPRYIGQMLKPPHDVAVAGYVAAMLHNPNNHALDGGPPTSAMEKELVPKLAALFGLPEATLGHLTSSGTIANLEALFVARETHPGKAIAYSREAHYTHARMCHVLGVQGVALPVDALGRLDLDAVEGACASGEVGTIVATAGTTGLGMVDPIAEIAGVAAAHGVRVHVDAAYGGFFAILAWADDETSALVPAADLRAIARCDSVVVDPHKHGLQPYGCGAILFADPACARFFLHDSPYTYFSSDELHLGEISLECSRSGAAAAALWLTERVIPWTSAGLGASLAAGCRAAARFRELLGASSHLRLYQRGDLDIVTYLPRAESISALDAESGRLFDAAQDAAGDPLFTATYVVSADQLGLRDVSIERDAESARILRSVVMKPENEGTVDGAVDLLEALSS